MGRRAEVVDSELSSQLSSFQQRLLSWSYWDLLNRQGGAPLRSVPSSFASFQARYAHAQTQTASTLLRSHVPRSD
jgi:hypothetical protein